MTYKGKAKQYERGRPSYPNEVADFITQNAEGAATVADIGAGTGKFTKELASRFATVFAVEPDAEMRNTLSSWSGEVNNVRIIAGSAESTGLDDDSVDIVCAAQALHWFNITSFKKEILRVLRPSGKVFIIHNVPPSRTTNLRLNDNEGSEEIEELFAKRKEDRRKFFGDATRVTVFHNPITYSKLQYVQYFMSLSTIDTGDGAMKKLMIEKIERDFDRISKDGRITLHFDTEVYTHTGHYRA